MTSATHSSTARLALAFSAIALLTQAAQAVPTVSAAYSADYTLTDLGPVPSLPLPYGGLTFKAGDPNTILIGGTANTDPGRLYAIGVVRGADNHITGFSGTATLFGTVGTYNDGGVVPSSTLFSCQTHIQGLGRNKNKELVRRWKFCVVTRIA